MNYFLEYFVLFIVSFISQIIIINDLNLKSNNLSINSIITILLTGPLFEECFFRLFLTQYCGHICYYEIINASLFGLIHMSNYPRFGLPFYTILIQVGHTTFLGYHLVRLDNVIQSIITHIIYNLCNQLLLVLLCYINAKFNIVDRMYGENPSEIKNHKSSFYPVHRRAKSLNFTRESRFVGEIRFTALPINKDNEYIIEYDKKLDKIDHEHYMKYYHDKFSSIIKQKLSLYK